MEGKALRKDIDSTPHDASAANIPLPTENQFSSIEAEEDLDDAELLGEATLAKLGGSTEEAADDSAANVEESDKSEE